MTKDEWIEKRIEDFNKQFVFKNKKGREVWTVQNFSGPEQVRQFIVQLFYDSLSI